MSDNKYGFKTTSLTLVEKLSRGEDWERFVNLYYRPVVNKFNAINRIRLKDKREIDEVDEGDVIADIFRRLKKGVQSSYNPQKGRLRVWMGVLVDRAIKQYYKDRNKEKSELLLDAENDDGATLKDNIGVADDYDVDRDWISYLQETAMDMAFTRHPWKKETKGVIKAMCDEMRKEPKEQRKDEELASELSITPASLRKIRERFCKEARKWFERFQSLEPESFAEYARTHGMNFDISRW